MAHKIVQPVYFIVFIVVITLPILNMKKYLLICILTLAIAPALMATEKKESRLNRGTHKTTLAKPKKKKSTAAKSRKSSAKKSSRSHSSLKKKISSSKKGIVAVEADNDFASNDESAIYANDLVNNRGKLPWPVDGVVSIPYGEYTIEGTRIKGKNPGITISTSDTDVPVKAVCDGIVSDVDNNGEVASVFIRHGKYYTVYSNVSSIQVNKGDVVKAGDVIGNIGEAYAAEGGELNFLLMDRKNNVDPTVWLSRQ